METKSMNVESLYVAPEIEILEVAVEAGFAGSVEEDGETGGSKDIPMD